MDVGFTIRFQKNRIVFGFANRIPSIRFAPKNRILFEYPQPNHIHMCVAHNGGPALEFRDGTRQRGRQRCSPFSCQALNPCRASWLPLPIREGDVREDLKGSTIAGGRPSTTRLGWAPSSLWGRGMRYAHPPVRSLRPLLVAATVVSYGGPGGPTRVGPPTVARTQNRGDPAGHGTPIFVPQGRKYSPSSCSCLADRVLQREMHASRGEDPTHDQNPGVQSQDSPTIG